ncbi:MAG: DsbA family protein [Actinomycetota bacterium]|jgi:predicted DsbA family dithiol-disulfide isomerase|nr:DsbA family protein [Euzebyaceae bacterium]MDQ3452510.1 DsbA family protein [Actinomycetota bacterium]
MTATVTIYSDIHCPWAALTVHRLRRARDANGLDVVFDPRAWPLELVNSSGTPRDIVETETAVLAQHEEELFSRFRGDSWPSSFLPAFEAVAAARRALGVRAAEDVDYALRIAFFRESADLSVRPAIAEAVAASGVDTEAVMKVWDREPVRADVLDDYARSADLPVQGSPQVFWPGGETTHNPGMTDHEWVRGIPRLRSVDADAAERLLLKHIAA